MAVERGVVIPSSKEPIDQHGGMSVLPDGWAWLYCLGCELNLDPQGPLALFLAQRMGFDDSNQLTSLPVLPLRQSLLDLAARLYAESDIWSAELLNKTVWLRYSASHLDLYYPLSAVDLRVRTAPDTPRKP